MQALTKRAPLVRCSEQRKYRCFNLDGMHIRVKHKGMLREFVKGVAVEWLNFNRCGLSFMSNRHFEIHERIVIDITTSNCAVRQLVAIIHNARKQAGIFRYGAQFYFGANSHMQTREIIEALQTIEQSLA